MSSQMRGWLGGATFAAALLVLTWFAPFEVPDEWRRRHLAARLFNAGARRWDKAVLTFEMG